MFASGATVYAGRDDPAKVAENADSLAARRREGFEHVAICCWRMFRFRDLEELLAATTLDAQVEALGGRVVETFTLLADAAPSLTLRHALDISNERDRVGHPRPPTLV